MKKVYTIAISILPLTIGWLSGFIVRTGKILLAALVEGYHSGSKSV